MEFIKFKNESARADFFHEVKNKSNLNWKDIAKELNISRSTLERYRLNNTHIPKEKFNNLLKYIQNRENILKFIEKIDSKTWLSRGGKKAYIINFEKFKEGREKGILAIKNRKEKNFKKNMKIISNFRLSNDLCEAIGAFIGDGFFNCYNNKLYQIEFAGDSRFDLEYYKNTIIPAFKSIIPNLNPHIYFVKNKNSIRIVFYSKELFYLLKDGFGFIPGKKAYTVTIPKIILESKNNEFINSTIRGIFDTDSGVFIDRRKIYKNPYPRISLKMSSKSLIEQLKDHLSKDFKLFYMERKNQEAYIIEIYGKVQLNKWMSKIGFSNSRHLNKIASVA